jgi:hypothetical protein
VSAPIRAQLSALPAGSREDHRLVEFALRWAPIATANDYIIPEFDEYILPEFGLYPAVYYRRLLEILQTPPCPRLDPPDRQRIIALCQHKLDASRPAIPE